MTAGFESGLLGADGLYPSEDAFYGKDIFFDGALHTGSDGDYITVNGMENLRRSLIRRYIVRPGEYRLRPSYGAGAGAFVKKRLTPTTMAQLKLRLRAQTLMDRRIKAVTSLDVTQQLVGDGYVVTILLIAQTSSGQRFAPRPFNISGSGGS